VHGNVLSHVTTNGYTVTSTLFLFQSPKGYETKDVAVTKAHDKREKFRTSITERQEKSLKFVTYAAMVENEQEEECLCVFQFLL
jgi:hypothetical protein